MIKAGSYCVAVSRKKLKGSTIEVGDYVYVADVKVAPISKDDPYLQRVFVLVIKVDKDTGKHYIPNNSKPSEEGDDGNKIYLVDPRGLELLGEDEVKRMVEAVNSEYEEKQA